MDTRKISKADKLAEKIWSYVRINQKSLLSEVHHKVISTAIQDAVQDLEKQAGVLQATIDMLTDTPPPPDPGAEWNKTKRMNGERAKWIYQYCVGRNVPRKYVSIKLNSDIATINKICDNLTWTEHTALLRKKYSK